MDIKNYRKELSYLIDSIKEHSDHLTDYDRLPKIELELILSKVKKLYEKTIIFNHLYEQGFFQENEKEIISKKETQTETKVESQDSDKIEKEEKAERPQPEPLNYQVEPEQPVKVEPKEPDVIPPSTPVSEVKPEKEELHSKLKEKVEQGSLNERIGQNKLYASLSSKLHMSPVADLSRAMGVNEKFAYTRELFQNNSEAFSESIKKLNSFNNFAEADHFISDVLAPKFNWDKDSETVRKFIELVQRRYL
jgi:type IV secretory pathway VirB10-like protein